MTGPLSRRAVKPAVLLAAGVLLGAAGLLAATTLLGSALLEDAAEAPQRFRPRRSSGYAAPEDLPIENRAYNDRFTFNRVRFTPARWGYGPYRWNLDLGWNHDWPDAERNLMLMLDELTSVGPNMGEGVVYRIDDPEIFKYPYAYLSEPGYWRLEESEIENLRTYLLKGGFLVVDDMQGWDINQLHDYFQRILPGCKFEILDTTHPIFNVFFEIKQSDILNQATNYAMPVIYGVYEDNDPGERLMVIINQNQDIGDSWEWSSSGYIPIELSNNSYKLGINYVVYPMTH